MLTSLMWRLVGPVLLLLLGSADAAFSAPNAAFNAPIRAIFSDVDGTLVHYASHFGLHGAKIVSTDAAARTAVVEAPDGSRRACRLVPSRTMGDGFVSERTCELVGALRSEGVKFVIVTAARKSTLFERLPMLPASDAACCETGSRVYLGADGGFEGDLEWAAASLDLEWAARFEAITGPLERELDVSERPEPLWQFFRTLQASVPGLKCDSHSYYGCFRVDTNDEPAVEAALRVCIDEQLPEGLDWAMNLGKFDFFPRLSGKGNVVAYLQAKFGVTAAESVCLFDDDNDLPMARRCEAHYLPGLTSESVERAAAAHPSWRVAARVGQGVFAVEEQLEEILQRVRGDKLAASTASDEDEALFSRTEAMLPLQVRREQVGGADDESDADARA